MSKVKITAVDLTTGECAEKIVNRGEMRHLQYFLDGINLFDDYNEMFPNSNKKFTDLDMVMESGGWLISVEFKHDIKSLNVGQYLLAENLSITGKGIYFFVVGDMNKPTHYFTIRSTKQDFPIQSKLKPLIDKEHFKSILKNVVKWTEAHALVKVRNEEKAEAKRRIEKIKYEFHGIK